MVSAYTNKSIEFIGCNKCRIKEERKKRQKEIWSESLKGRSKNETRILFSEEQKSSTTDSCDISNHAERFDTIKMETVDGGVITLSAAQSGTAWWQRRA